MKVGETVVCVRSDLTVMHELKFYTKGKHYEILAVKPTNVGDLGIVIADDDGDINIDAPLLMDGGFWTFEVVK